MSLQFRSSDAEAAVRRRFLPIAATALALAVAVPSRAASAASGTPVQIYGAWHCGNEACTWGTVRDVAEFDAKIIG
jgi:hypothetical protein